MRSYPTAPLSAVLSAPVLLVEDEPRMQLRLLKILETVGFDTDVIHVVGDAEKSHACLRQHRIATMLVDIGLPAGSGIDLIKQLRKTNPAAHILVLSAWNAAGTVLSALRAGATGYVLKEREDLEIVYSIRSLLLGGAPIDPFVAGRILAQLPKGRPDTLDRTLSGKVSLSNRETEILYWVSEGLSNRQIAERLHISRYTVECHIKRIYKKLAVSSRIQAVNTARRSGLLA